MSAAVNEAVAEWADEVTAVLPREQVERVRYYVGEDEVEKATYDTLTLNAEWLRAEGIQIEVER